MFAQALLGKVPLARLIRETLDSTKGNREQEEHFLQTLADHLSDKEAERVLRTVIDWGRYAEIFAFDVTTGILSLENPN